MMGGIEMKFKIITDIYTAIDMLEAGFKKDYLGKTESELEPGKYLYVFNDSKELSDELALYPPSTYLN